MKKNKLTLREKISLFSGKDYWRTRSYPEKGFREVFFSDGTCGIRKQKDLSEEEKNKKGSENLSITENVYPSPTLLASSFDRKLIGNAASEIGESAFKNHVHILLSPAINIKRIPQGGRNFEYFSEDTYLTSELAKVYIKELQKKNVGACVKHFVANNQEFQRYTINERISKRALEEIYLYAFREAVINAEPWAVMASYNKVNGQQISESKEFLTKILRYKWRYKGITVSDWGAVRKRVKALKKGLDLEMPGPAKSNNRQLLFRTYLGDLQTSTINDRIQRFKRLQNNLKEALEYKKIESEEEKNKRLEEKHEKIRGFAEQSAVLLKNKNNILPLQEDKKEKILIIGEFAENAKIQGGGSSAINFYKKESFLGIKEIKNKKYDYEKAFSSVSDRECIGEKEIKRLKNKAKQYDKILVFAGLPENSETEGVDRKNIRLPEIQNKIIFELAKVNKNIIVVLQNGGVVEMPWESKVQAILEMYLAGESAGGAIYNLLYGKVNPSGKLAETFPIKLSDTPAYFYYPGNNGELIYNEGIFVGYRYYDKREAEVLFPFGHGLSYTKFRYSLCEIKKLNKKYEYEVSVNIKNTGDRAGAEVVQLYVGYKGEDKTPRPIKELKGFEKIFLRPKEEKKVTFKLSAKSFAMYSEIYNRWMISQGIAEIYIGSSSRDIRLKNSIDLAPTYIPKKWVTKDTRVEELLDSPVLNKLVKRIILKVTHLEQGIGVNALNAEMLKATVYEGPLRLVKTAGIPEFALKATIAFINIIQSLERMFDIYKRKRDKK